MLGRPLTLAPWKLRLATLGFAVISASLGFRLAGSETVFVSFMGAFLVVLGGQIALWVFGIKLELLGNATGSAESMEKLLPEPYSEEWHEREFLRRQPPIAQPFSVALRISLKCLEIAEQEVGLGPLGELGDLRIAEFRKAAVTSVKENPIDPVAVILATSWELDRAERDYERPLRGRLWGDDSLKVESSIANAYRAFWDLRNSTVHGSDTPMAARTVYEILDISERLMRLLILYQQLNFLHQADG